ncbi:hypothetical protein DNTS_012927 [Danionella cerebrum]|uniref:Rho-GAP domain-containing protein n=1 Tax=Danionella cerebrum TaxID=2873325 RepID=A0A553MKH1_9TELE|nr:hypothetical protein DNTS_012927 [Danionella translucida]
MTEMMTTLSLQIVSIIEPIIQHADWFFPGEIEFNLTGSYGSPVHANHNSNYSSMPSPDMDQSERKQQHDQSRRPLSVATDNMMLEFYKKDGIRKIQSVGVRVMDTSWVKGKSSSTLTRKTSSTPPSAVPGSPADTLICEPSCDLAISPIPTPPPGDRGSLLLIVALHWLNAHTHAPPPEDPARVISVVISATALPVLRVQLTRALFPLFALYSFQYLQLGRRVAQSAGFLTCLYIPRGGAPPPSLPFLLVLPSRPSPLLPQASPMRSSRGPWARVPASGSPPPPLRWSGFGPPQPQPPSSSSSSSSSSLDINSNPKPSCLHFPKHGPVCEAPLDASASPLYIKTPLVLTRHDVPLGNPPNFSSSTPPLWAACPCARERGPPRLTSTLKSKELSPVIGHKAVQASGATVTPGSGPQSNSQSPHSVEHSPHTLRKASKKLAPVPPKVPYGQSGGMSDQSTGQPSPVSLSPTPPSTPSPYGLGCPPGHMPPSSPGQTPLGGPHLLSSPPSLTGTLTKSRPAPKPRQRPSLPPPQPPTIPSMDPQPLEQGLLDGLSPDESMSTGKDAPETTSRLGGQRPSLKLSVSPSYAGYGLHLSPFGLALWLNLAPTSALLSVSYRNTHFFGYFILFQHLFSLEIPSINVNLDSLLDEFRVVPCRSSFTAVSSPEGESVSEEEGQSTTL